MTAPGHALDPIALADGETWILPLAVLDDPAHASVKAVLGALTVRDVAEAELVKVDGVGRAHDNRTDQ